MPIKSQTKSKSFPGKIQSKNPSYTDDFVSVEHMSFMLKFRPDAPVTKNLLERYLRSGGNPDLIVV